MQHLNFEGPSGQRLCQDILESDGTIIFASIGSFSGFEIASASKASKALLMGDDSRLREKYVSTVALVVNYYKQAEHLFGKATRIVVTFEKNLRVIVIPLFSKEIFVVVVATREMEEKTLSFQISKRIERFIT